MFGIEKDFQKLMEQVYGPLGKKEQEECDRIAKQLVDNAIEEVKKMTDNKQTLSDIIEIDGVKYQRVEEPKSKVRTLYDICVEWNDDDDNPPVSALIFKIGKEWTPLNLNQKKNRGFTDEYSMGFDDAINMVRKTLR